MVIMHGEDKVAHIAKNGSIEVFDELWMPYDLYFEAASDEIDDDEKTSFAEINLYDHSLSNAFTDLSLRGKSMTVENAHMIADNLNTPGMFPKAWVRDGGTFFLLKDGDQDSVEKELLAGCIASCVSEDMKDRIGDAKIHTDILGSDHCPVELII